jgi:hypothetical protein
MLTWHESAAMYVMDIIFYTVIAVAFGQLCPIQGVILGAGLAAGIFARLLRNSVANARRTDDGSTYWLGYGYIEKAKRDA